MTIPDSRLAPRRVGGYRVLRALARDAGGEVLLGFREPEPGGAGASGGGSAGGESAGAGGGSAGDGDDVPVALLIAPATEQTWSRTLPLLEALERARDDHVVRLLDLAVDEQTVCVVTERLERGTLAELLALRERFDAGEVVTVIAPLAAALQRMHAAGVAHGGVNARRVMFRADGAPVLIGFGRATVFAPGAPEVDLEREPGVVADRRAARDLATALVSRIAGPPSAAARSLSQELSACADDRVLDLLASRVFEIAAALPVRFAPDAVEASARERVIPIVAPALAATAPTGPDAAAGRPGARLEAVARLIPDAWAQRVLDAVDANPVSVALRPLLARARAGWARWSSSRRRLVVALGAGAAALLIAVTVVPTRPADAARADSEPTASPSASARRVAGVSAPPSTASSDDPLAAATELVRQRDRWLSSLSLRCLDDLEQPDSGALRDDREAIRAAQQGGEAPATLLALGEMPTSELVARWGDSALVRLRSGTPDTPSASLLLVKGEAGWRIRDVIAAPKGSS